MRFLSTLYVVDHGARIGLEKQALIVRCRSGEWSRVPLNALDGVVIVGNAQMSSEALTQCAARQIRVAALNRSGRVRFQVGGPVSGNVHLRLAQMRVADDEERAIEVARWFVAAKLQNARRLLLRWASDASALERSVLVENAGVIAQRISELGAARDRDAVRGIEGDGTRRYFKGFAAHLSAGGDEVAFVGRSRRPPLDPPNALMGFVYGLLLTEIVGALDARGLDPQIGFLHGIRPGRPSLALDLLEEFRAGLADRFAARSLLRREVRAEHFMRFPGGACYLTDEGRRTVLRLYEAYRGENVRHPLLDRLIPRATLPVVQATLFARYLRSDLPAYPPFVIDG